ncbi:phytoene/squalene synthase family protein, partial [Sinorhizobium meliloti]
LSATGLDRETLLAGTDESAIERAVRAFCGLGRDHLAKAREGAGAISGRNFSAFIPVALAEPVFDRAEAAGARILRQSLQPPQWQRQWRMWRASRRREF